jgi:NitT/TauT family transport system substrate-binding protein
VTLRILAALLVLALPARAQTHLVLGVTAVAEFTPAYVAVDQGFFAKHGLDVTLQIVPNSATLIPAMLNGGVTVGGPPAPVFLAAAAQGLPITCFAAAAHIDPSNPTGAVLARPDITLTKPEDLLGKRVAVSGINSIMQVLLREWLTERHIDSKKITFVEVPFPRMSDSLKANAVDAVVAVAPFTSRMEANGTARLALDYYRDLPSGTLSATYCATRDWAEAHAPAIALFRASLTEARAFIEAYPEAARDVLARTLKLPTDVAGTLPMGTLDFSITPEQVVWWERVMRAQGLLDREIEPKSVLVQ